MASLAERRQKSKAILGLNLKVICCSPLREIETNLGNVVELQAVSPGGLACAIDPSLRNLSDAAAMSPRIRALKAALMVMDSPTTTFVLPPVCAGRQVIFPGQDVVTPLSPRTHRPNSPQSFSPRKQRSV